MFGNQRKNILGKNSALSADAQDLIGELDNYLGISLNKNALSVDEPTDTTLSISSKKDL